MALDGSLTQWPLKAHKYFPIDKELVSNYCPLKAKDWTQIQFFSRTRKRSTCFFCCDVTKVFNFNMYRAQWLLQSSRNNDSARLLAASLMLCAQKYNSTQSSFCYHTRFGEDWTRDFLHVSIFQPECRCRFIATQLFFVGQIYTNVLAHKQDPMSSQ